MLKYKILSPSKLEIVFNDKKAMANGELTVTRVFYADINSLVNWEAPNKIPVTEKEKKEIIEFITNDSSTKKVKVLFD
jgi:hypothetical protein